MSTQKAPRYRAVVVAAAVATLAARWSFAAAAATQPAATGPAAAQPSATQSAATQPAATRPAVDLSAVDPALVAKVDGLVGRLSDPDFRSRKQATDELERIGPAAEPVLRDRAGRPALPPDARTAIQVLLTQAGERRRAGASLVTLDLRQVEPLDAVGAVLRQAGLGMAAETEKLLRARAARRLDVRLDREPFWAALRKVAGDAGTAFAGLELAELRVSLSDAGGGGGVGAADPAAAPTSADGPFLLTVGRVEVTVRKAIDFAARRNPIAPAAASPPVRLSVSAWAEPRLKPAAWVVEGITECRTDTGKSLAASTYSYARTNKVNDASTAYLSVTGDTAGAKAIAKLTVRAHFVLQREPEVLEVDDVQKGVRELGQTVSGHRVVVRSVAKVPAEDAWAYDVSVFRDGRSPAEWLVFQQLLDRDGCRLLDAAGRPLPSRGGGSTNLGTDEVRVSGSAARAGAAGEPRKLRWELPGKLESRPATFEFTDVPLP